MGGFNEILGDRSCITSYKVEGRGSKTAMIEAEILSPPKSIYWFVILLLPPSL